MSTHPVRLLLGAYVLDRLTAAERAEVERHLDRCAECARELRDLQPVPSLLARVSLADVESAVGPPPPLPPQLLDRVLAAVEAPGGPVPVAPQRLGVSRRVLAAAAAVILLLAAGAGVALRAGGDRDGSTASAVAGSVRLDVRVAGGANGTVLSVTAAGLARNERCTLVAVARDGSRHVTGQWDAGYTGDARFNASTDVRRAQLERLDLLGGDGRTLVSVDL